MKVAVFGAAGWLGRAFLSNVSGRYEVRACDLGPQAWEAWAEIDGEWDEGEKVYGDIANYEVVERMLDGVDAVLHMILYSARGGAEANDDKPWLTYLKGLWNVLEAAQQRGLRRVVHLGSCQTVHPDGVFFSSDVRRPDYIVDTRIGLGRGREKLGKISTGWVCRHDLAEACRLALETEAVEFDVLHVVGPPEAEDHCNVGRTREVLGLEFKGEYDKYR